MARLLCACTGSICRQLRGRAKTMLRCIILAEWDIWSLSRDETGWEGNLHAAINLFYEHLWGTHCVTSSGPGRVREREGIAPALKLLTISQAGYINNFFKTWNMHTRHSEHMEEKRPYLKEIDHLSPWWTWGSPGRWSGGWERAGKTLGNKCDNTEWETARHVGEKSGKVICLESRMGVKKYKRWGIGMGQPWGLDFIW